MPTIVLFVQLATESRMEPIELRGSRGRGRLFEWVGSQKRFFTQAVELVVGARSAHAAFDAPDDDGVAAILAPKLGDAIESQKALRLSKRAADTERQHDGVVAAGAAFAGKDVVHNGRVKARVACDVRALDAALVDEAAQVRGKRLVDGFAFVQIGVDARTGQQPLEQVFRQVFAFVLSCQGGSNHRLDLEYIDRAVAGRMGRVDAAAWRALIYPGEFRSK